MLWTSASVQRFRPQRSVAWCTDATMRARELTRVPSQSNTSRRICVFTQFLQGGGPADIGCSAQLQCWAFFLWNAQPVCMQEQALAAELTDGLAEAVIAILVVAGNRVASVTCVHANLVGAAGHRTGFDQGGKAAKRSEEHTSELQSRPHLVCRLLLEKKKIIS